MQKYINVYFNIIEEYYNINKLLTNSDKSKLLVITKSSLRKLSKSLIVQANKYTIYQSTKIKVLGIYITSGFCNTATINNTISKINYRASVLKEVFKYSNFRTKLMLTNLLILSVIRYASPNPY